MNLYSFADKIVFRILQDIDSGYLEIISFEGKIMKFGFFILILAFKESLGLPNLIMSLLKLVISK